LKKRSKKLSYEEKRAIELMKVLDKCEALLDLHAYNEPYIESVPFAICEKNCLEIVKNFDVEYALTGIDKIEKGGTDGYMFNSGKIGICVELGSIENYEKFIDLGIKTSYQFLPVQYGYLIVIPQSCFCLYRHEEQSCCDKAAGKNS